jgi:D-alanyl-lipoteichoic acid acyltransferase DltB (MBOAT superfamily)
MTVASVPFLGFVLLVALVYSLARSTVWRQAVLLVANLAFFATFIPAPWQALPLVGFVLISYGALVLAQRGLSRAAFVGVMAGLLLLFFWLKRYSFLPQVTFLPMAYSVIGLSYMFFRMLHVFIDAYSGDLRERIGPVAYANYVLNFTSLVSGPIQRYQDYAAQQLGPKRPVLDWIVFGLAIERMATGLFKVVVLAAFLFGVHEQMLTTLPGEPTLLGRVVTVVGLTVSYTFYLYCNFSGYTDIVIGAARFYRLELPENFDRPFSSTSFLDFWGRWHMTLSNWLKTYVYNPLMMWMMARITSPRLGPYLAVIAFFFTFFLIGLWHGQTSLFAAYGVLLGLGVSINKLHQVKMAERLGRKRYRALAETFWYQSIARGLTFAYFSFSLMFFWGNWALLGDIAAGLGVAGIVLASLLLIAAASVVLSLWVALRDVALRLRTRSAPVLRSRYTRTVCVTTMGALAGAALAVLASPAPDIVYKTF